MVRLGFKNIYQIDMCSNEIGFCAQNLVTMLGSIVDIIGGWWVGEGEYIINFYGSGTFDFAKSMQTVWEIGPTH